MVFSAILRDKFPLVPSGFPGFGGIRFLDVLLFPFKCYGVEMVFGNGTPAEIFGLVIVPNRVNMVNYRTIEILPANVRERKSNKSVYCYRNSFPVFV